MVADERKDCKYYRLSQDAGHRAGLKHLVKMMSYPWIDTVDTNVLPGDSPTLLAQLLLIDGFTEAVHSNHFTKVWK